MYKRGPAPMPNPNEKTNLLCRILRFLLHKTGNTRVKLRKGQFLTAEKTRFLAEYTETHQKRCLTKGTSDSRTHIGDTEVTSQWKL